MTGTGLLAVCVAVTALAVAATGMSAAVGGAIILAAAAAATDAWDRRIPNLLSGAVALTAAMAWLQADGPMLGALMLALTIGIALYVAFEFDVMGGGDVKLIPSLALVAAVAGTPEQAPIRAALFLGTLFSVAAVWAVLDRSRDAPVAVGAALALAIAVA